MIDSQPSDMLGIGRIEAHVDVRRHAGERQLAAHVAARAAPGHGIEHVRWLEIPEQIADEVPAAVARIRPIPIWTRLIEVVQAGDTP